MCTAITYTTKDHYFGRTLDNEISYREQVVITPRSYPLPYRNLPACSHHYAMIGMACVLEGYPLYYDAVNEKGLAIAGLNFVGNAVYADPVPHKENVAQFELIPWLLSSCENLSQAREAISGLNITNQTFAPQLPAAQLHWMIADKTGAIVLESTLDGLHVYDDPVGTLTNNPSFPEQLFSLNHYMHLSSKQPENRFCPDYPLQYYSRGMGSIGLPGDYSSQSRFVRAAFVRANSRSGSSEADSVGQFFHILGSVDQPRGCCEAAEGSYVKTIYTSCCNLDRGIYYYTCYGNQQITAVHLYREDLDKTTLAAYPVISSQQIRDQN